MFSRRLFSQLSRNSLRRLSSTPSSSKKESILNPEKVEQKIEEIKPGVKSVVQSQRYLDERLGSWVWLSDPGVYPLIGLLVTASCGWVFVLFYNLRHNPEIRFKEDKRKSTIRWWLPT
jgi:hypothetical protein